MRGGDDDTIPVDLVEVDSPDALRGPADTRAHEARGATTSIGTGTGTAEKSPRARRAGRRLIVLGAAVVLALAATGAVLALLDARRADARWDALAERGLPLVDLGSPLEEVWRMEGGGWPMAVSPDVLVVQVWSPTASRSSLRGLDLETGEALWERTDIGQGWCNPWHPGWSDHTPDEVSWGTNLGFPGAFADPTMLVCTEAGFGGGLPAAGDTSTIRVVELASGRDIGAVVVEGHVVTFYPIGEDVVVASAAADGTIDVIRAGLLDGAVTWAAQTDTAAVDDDGVLAWPHVRDGVLHLVSAEGRVVEAIDLETGAPTAAVADLRLSNGGWFLLADGSRVDITYGLMMAGDGANASWEPTITVSGPDGAERFAIEGELWSPLFNDGSMADRIVVSRQRDGASRLTALDVVTGEELWTVPATWSTALLQVDGVVVAGSSYLAATDLRTGEQLWERTAGDGAGVSTVTDGSRLAVPIREDDATWLVALDIPTGAEAWRTSILPDLQWVQVVDGAVLLGSGVTLALYR